MCTSDTWKHIVSMEPELETSCVGQIPSELNLRKEFHGELFLKCFRPLNPSLLSCCVGAPEAKHLPDKKIEKRRLFTVSWVFGKAGRP